MSTKTEFIVEILRDEIAAGVLPKGSRLLQDEVAKRFNTSSTPVREALRQLQAAGLVVGSAHQGVAVASPNADHIRSTYVMLRLLEPYAALRASNRMSRVDFAAARRINEQYAASCREGDVSGALKLDTQFHARINQHCGLTALANEIHRLQHAFPWGVHGRSEAPEEHDRILDAMIEGDDARVESLVADHVLAEFRSLLDHIGDSLEADPFLLEIE